MAGIGDINGDGFDDFAIGAERARGYEYWSGTVSIYFGGQHPDSRPRLQLKGPYQSSNFGYRVAQGLDVNGDGHPDVIVGAFERFTFTRPHARERWIAGGSANVLWTGAARAEVEWKPSPGGEWRSLAHGAGGRESNAISVKVPAEARGQIRLRLRPSDSHLFGEAISDTVLVTPGR